MNNESSIDETDKEQMVLLMDEYNVINDNMLKLMGYKKKLNEKLNNITKQLEEIMTKYDLLEVIKGDRKFIINNKVKKTKLKQEIINNVISTIVKDDSKITEINNTVDKLTKYVPYKKLECIKLN